MGEWLIAMALVMAAYCWGRQVGHSNYERGLVRELQAGRSPKARALRAVIVDESISQEIDR